MNIVAEIEKIIAQFTGCSIGTANITANQILDMFNLFGIELKIK
jgi:hypothetical protein